MELRKIAEEIREVVEEKKEELNLSFIEETHTYFMRDHNGETRKDWPSVSKLLKLYLPGTLEEKCAPWALPVIDVLEEHLGKGVVETGMKNGNIEIAPLALMRGRSFNNAFVICDEAQNITFPEMKMLVTRIGEGSKLVLNGDLQQSDLKDGDGLTKIVHLVKKHMLPVPIVEFTTDDIVRSDMTKLWIETFVSEGI